MRVLKRGLNRFSTTAARKYFVNQCHRESRRTSNGKPTIHKLTKIIFPTSNTSTSDILARGAAKVPYRSRYHRPDPVRNHLGLDEHSVYAHLLQISRISFCRLNLGRVKLQTDDDSRPRCNRFSYTWYLSDTEPPRPRLCVKAPTPRLGRH